MGTNKNKLKLAEFSKENNHAASSWLGSVKIIIFVRNCHEEKMSEIYRKRFLK